MSVVVMVNEKFREGVPTWEVLSSNLLLIYQPSYCIPQKVHLLIIKNVLSFILQSFKQNPQHFHGFFQHIMEISLADDVCMHQSYMMLVASYFTKNVTVSVFFLNNNYYSIVIFLLQVLTIREQSIILTFLIHCFNSLVGSFNFLI